MDIAKLLTSDSYPEFSLEGMQAAFINHQPVEPNSPLYPLFFEIPEAPINVPSEANSAAENPTYETINLDHHIKVSALAFGIQHTHIEGAPSSTPPNPHTRLNGHENLFAGGPQSNIQGTYWDQSILGAPSVSRTSKKRSFDMTKTCAINGHETIHRPRVHGCRFHGASNVAFEHRSSGRHVTAQPGVEPPSVGLSSSEIPLSRGTLGSSSSRAPFTPVVPCGGFDYEEAAVVYQATDYTTLEVLAAARALLQLSQEARVALKEQREDMEAEHGQRQRDMGYEAEGEETEDEEEVKRLAEVQKQERRKRSARISKGKGKEKLEVTQEEVKEAERNERIKILEGEIQAQINLIDEIKEKERRKLERQQEKKRKATEMEKKPGPSKRPRTVTKRRQ